MAEQFYTILTKVGKAKIANASALGTKVNFSKFQVGDSNGSYYNPTEDQTSLKNKVWEGNINSISVDEKNPNWIVIEILLPSNIGGFMIREAAILDDENNMIAVAKYPETYKPITSEGSSKDLLIRTILEVSNTSSVTLKVDPTVILATKKDIEILENKINNIKVPVTKVNNKTGDVVLSATDIKAADGKTLEQFKTETTSQLGDYTKIIPYAVATGTANTYIISNPAITTLSAGMAVSVKINVASTGVSTLNWDNKGAKLIKKANGTNATNLKAGGVYTLRYDGSAFILQGEGGEGNAQPEDVWQGKTFTNDNGEQIGTLKAYRVGDTISEEDMELTQKGGVKIWEYSTRYSASGRSLVDYTFDDSGYIYLFYYKGSATNAPAIEKLTNNGVLLKEGAINIDGAKMLHYYQGFLYAVYTDIIVKYDLNLNVIAQASLSRDIFDKPSVLYSKIVNDQLVITLKPTTGGKYPYHVLIFNLNLSYVRGFNLANIIVENMKNFYVDPNYIYFTSEYRDDSYVYTSNVYKYDFYGSKIWGSKDFKDASFSLNKHMDKLYFSTGSSGGTCAKMDLNGIIEKENISLGGTIVLFKGNYIYTSAMKYDLNLNQVRDISPQLPSTSVTLGDLGDGYTGDKYNFYKFIPFNTLKIIK